MNISKLEQNCILVQLDDDTKVFIHRHDWDNREWREQAKVNWPQIEWIRVDELFVKQHGYDPKKHCCFCGSAIKSTLYFNADEVWMGASEGLICIESRIEIEAACQ